jgi:hypothetical protein
VLRQAQHERALICHPSTPAANVSGVSVEWTQTDDDDVLLTFAVAGAGTLLLPDWRSPVRKDELWRTTCFELFWRAEKELGYTELNFSPSTEWAAYTFDDYRTGMRSRPLPVDPFIGRQAGEPFTLAVDLDLSALPTDAARVGLSAVIEEVDGTKSYWALAHPPGAPDFHHPDCFALHIPALA